MYNFKDKILKWPEFTNLYFHPLSLEGGDEYIWVLRSFVWQNH